MCTADSASTLTGPAMLRKKTVNNRFKAIAFPRVTEALYEAALRADHSISLILKR